MKKVITFLLIICIVFSDLSITGVFAAEAGKNEAATATDASTDTVKVLFVGNSFTLRNNLPRLFKGIAKADGQKVKVKKIAYGGYRLNRYSSKNTRAGKEFRNMMKEKWDYVVLQGYSSEFLEYYNSGAYHSLRKLVNMVKKNGAEPILYMTWARQDGISYSNRSGDFSFNRDEMTLAVSDTYEKLGNEFGLKVAPVGQNFLRCRDEYPDINLYNKDRKHPKFAGSYLAACTIYETIFDRSALNNGYHNTDEKKIGIGKKKASKLQALSDIRMKVDQDVVYMKPGSAIGINAQTYASPDNELYNEKYINRDIISYTSLTTDICIVNETTGVITALAPGKGYIRAMSKSGLSAIITVFVKSRETINLNVTPNMVSERSLYSDNLLRWTGQCGYKYDIYRSIETESHYVHIATVCSDYFIDQRKIRGRKYFYKITASKINGADGYPSESNVSSVSIKKKIRYGR